MVKVFVVHMTEHDLFGRAVTYIVGVFDTRLAASQALEKVFLKQCDIFCVDKELNDETQCDPDNSFYNEGKEFNIDYRRQGALAGEVYGEIEEIEMNRITLYVEEDKLS